jgi:hypothetical protein
VRDELNQFVDGEEPADRQRSEPVGCKATPETLNDFTCARDTRAIARDAFTGRYDPIDPDPVGWVGAGLKPFELCRCETI